MAVEKRIVVKRAMVAAIQVELSRVTVEEIIPVGKSRRAVDAVRLRERGNNFIHLNASVAAAVTRATRPRPVLQRTALRNRMPVPKVKQSYRVSRIRSTQKKDAGKKGCQKNESQKGEGQKNGSQKCGGQKNGGRKTESTKNGNQKSQGGSKNAPTASDTKSNVSAHESVCKTNAHRMRLVVRCKCGENHCELRIGELKNMKNKGQKK